MYRLLMQFLIFQFNIIRIIAGSKSSLILEIIELRQQLAAYKAKNIRPKSNNDIIRSVLIALKETYKNWKESLVIVKPETVIDWHQRRFKKYWTKISHRNRKQGRKPKTKEIRGLIYKIAIENKTWGAPRIYSEILMLGFSRKDISQRTVSRYLKKIRPNNNDPAIQKKRQQWKTFLGNHREQIMAMDFFTVPTVSFKILYVFFIIDHARREIVHFNISRHPTSIWVKNQLRSAFPFDSTPKYIVFDRDSIFQGVKSFIKDIMNIKPKMISYQSPWQNGVAERWILSARTELLNHVIIFNEGHLKSLLKEYVSYYNNDRGHLSINRNTPTGREISEQTSRSAKVVSLPRISGLHHRYEWRDAA